MGSFGKIDQRLGDIPGKESDPEISDGCQRQALSIAIRTRAAAFGPFVGDISAMKVLAADGYILCCGVLRTLMLLYDDVCVTAANSIGDASQHLVDAVGGRDANIVVKQHQRSQHTATQDISVCGENLHSGDVPYERTKRGGPSTNRD